MFVNSVQNEQVMNIQDRSAFPYIEYLATKWEPKYEYSQVGEEKQFYTNYKGEYIFLHGTRDWLVNKDGVWKPEPLLKIYLVIKADTKRIRKEKSELNKILRDINTSNKMDIENKTKRTDKKQINEWYHAINEKMVTAETWLHIRKNVLMDAIDAVKNYSGMSRGIETFEIINWSNLKKQKILAVRDGRVNPAVMFKAKNIC